MRMTTMPMNARGLLTVASLALLLYPTSARAQEETTRDGSRETRESSVYEPIERPPSGVGFVLAGGLAGALAGGSFLGALACVGQPIETECLGVTLAVGSTSFVASVPLIIVGLQKNAELRRWREGQLQIVPHSGGTMLRLQVGF